MTSRPGGPIAFTRPWFDSREEAAVHEALTGQTSGDGPIGRRVEARLAAELGASRVLLTTSGTHALELALLALEIGPGDEVDRARRSPSSPAPTPCSAWAPGPVFVDVRTTR